MSPLPLILASVMAHGMGQTIVFAVLAPLSREVGLAELDVGLIIAASSVVFAWASPRWGRASERLGRRRTILIGLVGYTLGTLAFATAFLAGMKGWLVGGAVLAACVLARMFQSTLMAATAPAATAYIADITTLEQRTAGMSRLGAAHNIGTIAGPAVGGALAMISLLAPLWIAAAITLVTAFFVWRGLPEAPRAVPAGPGGPGGAHGASHGMPHGPGYFDPRVFPFLVIGVALYIGFSAIQQTLGFHIQDRLQIDGRETAKLTGMAMMLGAVASLAAQVLAMRRAWTSAMLLGAGLPLMLAGTVLLMLAEGRVLMACSMVGIGAGMGLAGPGFMASASRAVGAHEQGAVAGLVSAAPALGYIIGPLAGTALYQVDPHWPYAAVAVSFVPLIAYARKVLRNPS